MARLILSLDGQVLAEYNMMQGAVYRGPAPGQRYPHRQPTVSGHHSLIINILNDSFLEDLNSTNGTYVNGKLIKKHALQNGDVITVGRHQLRFVDSATDSEDHDEFSPTMVIECRSAKSDDGRQCGVHATAAGFERCRGTADRRSPAAAVSVQDPGPQRQLCRPGSGAQQGPHHTWASAGVQVMCDHPSRADGYQPRAGGERTEPRTAEAQRPADRLTGTASSTDNDVIELIGIKMGFFLD
jgi:predicted component of type VI protein secretion system